VLCLKNNPFVNCPNPLWPAIFKVGVNQPSSASFLKQGQGFFPCKDPGYVTQGFAGAAASAWRCQIVVSRVAFVEWITAVTQLVCD